MTTFTAKSIAGLNAGRITSLQEMVNTVGASARAASLLKLTGTATPPTMPFSVFVMRSRMPSESDTAAKRALSVWVP